MPDNDAAQSGDTTQTGESTPETGSTTQTGSTADEQIASYRKRQAGAEAARAAAERKLADAETELAAFRTKNQTASQQEAASLATLQERLTQAEQRATEAEAKAEARILDARFPNARKELPEVTDEVRLAKFEAMLRDDETPETPSPRTVGANPQRQPSGTTKSIEDMTVDELKKHILTFDPSVMTMQR